MSDQQEQQTPVNNLDWAGRVWSGFSRLECAGVLHIALRYERDTGTNTYIDAMSQLAWADLGRPLQIDVHAVLSRLQKALGR